MGVTDARNSPGALFAVAQMLAKDDADCDDPPAAALLIAKQAYELNHTLDELGAKMNWRTTGNCSGESEAANVAAEPKAGNGADEAGPGAAEVDADSIDSSALRNVLEAIELATSRLDGVAGTLSTSIPLLDRVDQQGDIRPLYLCRDEVERIRGFLDRLTTTMIRAKGRGEAWDIGGAV